MNIPRPIIYNEESVKFLDQRALPQQEIYLDISSLEDSFEAIKNMVVRGAPLIGFSALWGMVMWLKKNPKATGEDYEQACDRLKLARPTAVNLAYELDCSKELLKPFFLEGASFETLLKALREFVIL